MQKKFGNKKREFGGKTKNHGERKNFGRRAPAETARKAGPRADGKPHLTTHCKTEIEGVIKLAGKKGGFVLPENYAEEIRIDPNYLGTAFHDDTVLVLLHTQHNKGEQQTGEVIKVLSRAKSRFVGTIKSSVLVPDDRRVYTDLAITETRDDAKDGMKALIEITNWNADKPEGKIVQVLGAPGDHETEIKSILAGSGIVYDFPDVVEQEANDLKANFPSHVAKALRDRRDLRSTPTFTIDPADAKDFDDALSIKKLEPSKTGGARYEVGVHIADVSYFVRPGTKLDEEASSRANSVYLVDRTVPMLPEALSADICSLVPDQDRLTYSSIFVMDGMGNVESEWFGQTTIHSQKRFTYEEASQVLDKDAGVYIEELKILDSISKNLHKARLAKGSIIFEKDEIKVELGPDKKPVRIYIKERLATHKLIEEFMLLANKHVAHYLFRSTGKLGGGAVYRIHDKPDPDRIEVLKVFLRSLGYRFEGNPRNFGAREINELFAQMKGEDIEMLVQTAVLRSMSKAIYSVANIGHFGLGFEYYTHFTSPIRRYPDLMVHRLLTKYLSGQPIDKLELANYERVARYASSKEKEAADAERESIKYKQAEYMQTIMASQPKKQFEGIITGVTEWGIFIEEQKSKCEGMLRLSSIGDDFYEFDEKKFALIGKRTKKVYRLGDRIEVKLSEVDVQRHHITWDLA